ncbi:hypothetical protein CDAR_204561, partial [Caerostris darwini]
MEVSNRKNQSIKKKRKKKQPNNNNIESVVKPEFFDGITNWMKLQQVLEKEEGSENPSKPKKKSYPSKLRKMNPPNEENKYTSKNPKNRTEYKFDFTE